MNSRVGSPEDVQNAPALVGFSERMTEENRELKGFLRTRLYRHYKVVRMTSKARKIIRDLFSAFGDDLRLLPEQYQLNALKEGAYRVIADYIAGMTDRYAVKEHRRLFAIGEI